MPAEFLKGDRVIGTQEYVRQFKRPWSRRIATSGIVTSNQRGDAVNVRLEGNATSNRFHVDFWRRARPNEATPDQE